MVLKQKTPIIVLSLLILLSSFVLAENNTLNETKVLIDTCINSGGEWEYDINNTLKEGYCECPNGEIRMDGCEQEIFWEGQENINLCNERGGEVVNLRTILYCKINESTYIPLEDITPKNDTMKIGGMEVYNIGAIISKNYPAMGWIIFFIAIMVVVSLLKDRREVAIEERIRRIDDKETKRQWIQREQADRRRKRSDGGYY